MKTWVRKTLSVGILAAGALLLAPGAAHAGVSQDTSYNSGFLNGNQIAVPISVPFNQVGNAIGVAGEANAAGVGHNRTEGGGWVGQDSAYNHGILNGNQIAVPINFPVNIVGNADAVLGHANAAGVGSNGRRAESGKVTEHGWPGQGTGQYSSYNSGFVNGNQISVPIDQPVNICGNSLALLGLANSQAVCSNGRGGGRREGIRVDQDASYNHGFLNGNQISVPIDQPTNICGNALGILGAASGSAVCGNGDGFGGDRGHDCDHSFHGCNGNGGINGHDCDHKGHSCRGNAGDKGDRDDAGDNGYGNADDDGQLLGDNGALGNDDADDNPVTGYGSDTKSDGGRMAKSGTEGSPVSGLTQGVGDVGGAGLGGLNLLSTLR
jgi:hypothetical protein